MNTSDIYAQGNNYLDSLMELSVSEQLLSDELSYIMDGYVGLLINGGE